MLYYLDRKRVTAKGDPNMKSLTHHFRVTFKSLLSDLQVTFCAFPFCGSPSAAGAWV